MRGVCVLVPSVGVTLITERKPDLYVSALSLAEPFVLLVDALQSVEAASGPLMWLSIGLFVFAGVLEFIGQRGLFETIDVRQSAVWVGAIAWGVFGAFWLSMFPYFYFDVQSPLQGVLSLAGAPLCLYTGYLLAAKRDSLLLLTRAVGLMGLIYVPFIAIEPARTWLIETVAVQTQFGMGLLGYSPAIEEGANGYMSRFVMEPYTGHNYSTYIVLACTGIGSISIFGGLIAALRAPWKRKVLAIVAATGVIWVLNLGRNVFVGLAAPLGWFDYGVFHSITGALAGEGMRTSFFVSHHLISQTLSVVALLGITFLVVKLVPETVTALEELLFVLTGKEHDLAAALGLENTEAEPATPADD